MKRAKSSRQSQILAELDSSPSLRVAELARRLDVSTETIRRDLDELTDQGLLNRTYGGGMPLKDVFRDLARSLPGIDIGSIDVSGNLPPKGVHASGRVAETLDWLADRYGVTWSIQGGVLQVIKDGQGLPGEALEISSRNRNLISISPSASGPDAAQDGVEIIAQLDPSIRPGSVVSVDSHDQPNLNGFYVAQSVNALGDTHGDDWTMTIRSTARP